MSELVSRTLVGRYELLRRLGRGAFGAVYEALDRPSGARVALKALTRVSPLTLAQFKQEFRGMQEVHHRNLVRLEALFEDRGTWFIAMELIEGTDLLGHLFAEHERFGFAESELRAVFLQLATGLEALHAAGFVHRDLKPANVRVTPEGRAVLLDFGLTVAADLGVQTTRAIGHGGTLAYMAPEQAASLNMGPAADWYAFGVCLYEAMTGVLPIDGETALELLAAKQRTNAPRPSSDTPGLPADLDELCRSLLELDPRARPGATRVRWVLARPDGLGALPLPIATASAIGSPHAVFEGRARELQLLEEAFARVGLGEHELVLVEGESGIGKSALVEHFIAARSGCLTLRSRCYENELLAYKAFGGAIETIASSLARLPPAQCEALLPPRAAVLCRLFPEFGAVGVLAGAGLVGVTGDPSAQRLEAFSVLTRLLAALCERAPIVFAIDDLQWADSESFHLLQAYRAASRDRRLLMEVRALVETLKRADVKPHEPDRLCIEAQLAALEGDLDHARSLAQTARQEAAAAGQHFLARCLDYFEGALVGGTQGAESQAQALAFFSAQGWKEPRRAVAILCPALDAHEAS
jgi:eukaryotic-like serine/threonine-protein kinase